MSRAPTHSLSRDSLAAASGVWRLLRFDPTWSERFDLTRLGLVRSFFAQILVLPLVVMFAVLTERADTGAVTQNLVWRTILSDVIGVVGYPLIVALIARLLHLKRWGAFIAVLNWADLIFGLIFAALSALTLLGEQGLMVLRIIWLLILAPIQILFTWRAARETMASDISATVLLVVIELALSIGADQLAALTLPA